MTKSGVRSVCLAAIGVVLWGHVTLAGADRILAIDVYRNDRKDVVAIRWMNGTSMEREIGSSQGELAERHVLRSAQYDKSLSLLRVWTAGSRRSLDVLADAILYRRTTVDQVQARSIGIAEFRTVAPEDLATHNDIRHVSEYIRASCTAELSLLDQLAIRRRPDDFSPLPPSGGLQRERDFQELAEVSAHLRDDLRMMTSASTSSLQLFEAQSSDTFRAKSQQAHQQLVATVEANRTQWDRELKQIVTAAIPLLAGKAMAASRTLTSGAVSQEVPNRIPSVAGTKAGAVVSRVEPVMVHSTRDGSGNGLHGSDGAASRTESSPSLFRCGATVLSGVGSGVLAGKDPYSRLALGIAFGGLSAAASSDCTAIAGEALDSSADFMIRWGLIPQLRLPLYMCPTGTCVPAR